MKRLVLRSLAVLLVIVLLLPCSALAGAFEDYTYIVNEYNKAEADEYGAIPFLTELVRYYTDCSEDKERTATLNEYADAKLYLYYAMGRIAIENGEYEEGYEYLSKCGTFNGDKIDVYLNFAAGMTYLNEGFYADALELLRTVQTYKVISAKCTNAIEECEKQYKAEILSLAQEACNRGNHEKAQEYYKELLTLLPADLTVKKLLKQCETTHGAEADSLAGEIIITECEETEAGTVTLRWEGKEDSYTVSWTMKPGCGTTDGSAEVADTECSITGLYPNTEYFVTVEGGGASAVGSVRTSSAPEYDSDGFKWNGASGMYRYKNRNMLKGSLTSYNYLKKEDIRPCEDSTIDIANPSIKDGLIHYTFIMRENISDSTLDTPYVLLLHVDGCGTSEKTGTVGDMDVCFKANVLHVIVYDLFDSLLETRKDFEPAEYTVELLLNVGDEIAPDYRQAVSVTGILR